MGKKLIESFLDIRNIVYVLSMVFIIAFGWGDIKERVSLLAQDIGYCQQKNQAQDHCLETIVTEMKSINRNVIKNQVLLERIVK